MAESSDLGHLQGDLGHIGMDREGKSMNYEEAVKSMLCSTFRTRNFAEIAGPI